MLRDEPTLVATLWARTGEADRPALLATIVCPTHPCSPSMTAAYLAVSVRGLVVAELERMQRTGCAPAAGEAFTSVVREARPARKEESAGGIDHPNEGAPPRDSRAATGDRRTSKYVRYATRALDWGARKLTMEQRWELLLGEDRTLEPWADPSKLRSILPPAGHYWADPHVLVEAGETHIFFEDFVYADGRGLISVMTLGADGLPGPPRRVIETDTHLSYPHIFRHEGRLFMVPESAEAGTVDLYECVRVPDEWVFRRSLLTGDRLVDATLLEWEGRWWMFASQMQPYGLRGADILELYTTDDPVTGEWTKHAASPILADVTGSRSAGTPFVHDGRLYRPAQDGSHGYGWGIALKEVLTLTPTSYAERRVGTIAAPDRRDVCGVHTLNRAGGTVVMDLCRWMPRKALTGPGHQVRHT